MMSERNRPPLSFLDIASGRRAKSVGSDAQARQEREPARSLWSELLSGLESAALKVSPVYYGIGLPRGDGAPVVLVPGFLGTDLSLVELHLWLGRMGYRSYPSGIGWNADCPDILLERLDETIARAYRETGRKVHLIGHSLGGLLARAAAVRRPEQVAQVITLGTPFRRLSAHPMVRGLLKRVLRRRRRETPGSCVREFFGALRACLHESVARTAIFSRTDPVVEWRDAVEADSELNVEVRSTHVGMPVNAQVYRELARLLAPPEQIQKPATLPSRLDAALPLAA